MIKAFKKWKLVHTFSRLRLKNGVEYEYVCKKLLQKHWFKIENFEKMDLSREWAEYDPYLREIARKEYTLQSY